jgi:tetratricopeptide (TPR) repeat protein
MKSQAIFDTRAIATRLFVLALLFATPRIPASAQELIFDTFMNDASAALKQNKLDDAQRLFASAMNEPYAKEHPGGVLCATYGLAIVKQQNKQYTEAERLLLQAMELLPKDSTAPATRSLLQFTLGKMYAKEGKLETADASLRSALDLSDSANEHFIATPAILTNWRVFTIERARNPKRGPYGKKPSSSKKSPKLSQLQTQNKPTHKMALLLQPAKQRLTHLWLKPVTEPVAQSLPISSNLTLLKQCISVRANPPLLKIPTAKMRSWQPNGLNGVTKYSALFNQMCRLY